MGKKKASSNWKKIAANIMDKPLTPEVLPPREKIDPMTVYGSYNTIRALHTIKPTFNENYLLFSRRFEGSIKPKNEGQMFRVMSWNMLAQG